MTALGQTSHLAGSTAFDRTLLRVSEVLAAHVAARVTRRVQAVRACAAEAAVHYDTRRGIERSRGALGMLP
ncbi:hypothetical protein [Microbacterium xanthum]|uniref:hypothetical protein n=1 Tax=Microbacterium xanthum TaxID=3079794 RepID=UPI002AD39627|nr:hypothetical protein [Microbacterium sp. KSW-48]MDZ8172395.1 hypothetical protein [Microbacterium sp. KSW-48]